MAGKRKPPASNDSQARHKAAASSATSTMRASPRPAARTASSSVSLLSSFAFVPRPPHLYLLLTSLLVFFLFLYTVLFAVNLTPAASTASPALTPPVVSARPSRSSRLPPGGIRPFPASSSFVPPVTRLSPVASHPHDSGCFTQGLEWYGDVLYESCGITGQSSIRIVNGSSGRVLQQRQLDRAYFAEGLTVWQDRVYQLTWREHVVLVWSLNLTLLQTLPVETEGWGITHDSQHLILSDGSSRLYYRDPLTLAVDFTRDVSIVRSASSSSATPLRHLNELEYIPGVGLLANVWMSTDVVLIDEDGQVQHRLDAEPLLRAAGGDNGNKVVNGLAWRADTNRLWMTGKLWPTMYEVQLPDLS